MKRLLLPACLLVACGNTAPRPSTESPQETPRQLTYGEALDLLPFRVFSSGRDPLTPGTPLNSIAGVGSVTPQEVVETLKLAGIVLSPDQVRVVGVPAVPPALPSGSPVHAALVAPGTGRSGAPYQVTVQLTNVTAQTLNGKYGEAALDAVIEDSSGKAVFWATPGLVHAVAYNLDCPPLGTCDQELKLNFDLNRFQPRFPLKPGDYTLKVFVTGLTFSKEYAQDLRFQLPPQKLTLLP
ncbi:hypothetical protein [Deinococcus sp. Leaf326]|uniref:hypothetical protein n=1 Tax=Deinococcus sp. Leaf326 TaxID=1736338 RepID=UPI000B0328B8|nr:hypothetical protein [Deinococcus sp. Leaf326]